MTGGMLETVIGMRTPSSPAEYWDWRIVFTRLLLSQIISLCSLQCSIRHLFEVASRQERKLGTGAGTGARGSAVSKCS